MYNDERQWLRKGLSPLLTEGGVTHTGLGVHKVEKLHITSSNPPTHNLPWDPSHLFRRLKVVHLPHSDRLPTTLRAHKHRQAREHWPSRLPPVATDAQGATPKKRPHPSRDILSSDVTRLRRRGEEGGAFSCVKSSFTYQQCVVITMCYYERSQDAVRPVLLSPRPQCVWPATPIVLLLDQCSVPK